MLRHVSKMDTETNDVDGITADTLACAGYIVECARIRKYRIDDAQLQGLLLMASREWRHVSDRPMLDCEIYKSDDGGPTIPGLCRHLPHTADGNIEPVRYDTRLLGQCRRAVLASTAELWLTRGRHALASACARMLSDYETGDVVWPPSHD